MPRPLIILALSCLAGPAAATPLVCLFDTAPGKTVEFGFEQVRPDLYAENYREENEKSETLNSSSVTSSAPGKRPPWVLETQDGITSLKARREPQTVIRMTGDRFERRGERLEKQAVLMQGATVAGRGTCGYRAADLIPEDGI